MSDWELETGEGPGRLNPSHPHFEIDAIRQCRQGTEMHWLDFTHLAALIGAKLLPLPLPSRAKKRLGALNLQTTLTVKISSVRV